MKIKRFFSIFLLTVLVVSLLATPFAAADEPVLPEDPNILAKAALLVDTETGTVVYGKDEHAELYPASLTKIMTALLVLEAIEDGKLSLTQEVTASETAFVGLSADGSSANIKVGEIMSVENLLKCMLVVSANEACDILAEAVSGSVDAFVDQMNQRAQALGCINTHFVNPNGLHDPQHYTSAWDIYLITRAAMEHPLFMSICDTANVIIPATNMSKERNLWTTNHLLSNWRVIGYRNKEAHGIKTGSTDAAGHCLVSSAVRGSLSFVSVVLGAERVEENGVGNIRSFSETTRLFNYGFENFSHKTIITPDEPIQEVAVSLSDMDHVTVHPDKSIEMTVANGLEPKHLERTVALYEKVVEAPVSKGDILGTLTLSYDGKEYATVNLLAMHDVEASQKLVFLRDMELFFQRSSVKMGIVAVIVLILLLIVWRLLARRRRYRYGRSSSHGSRNYRGRRRR